MAPHSSTLAWKIPWMEEPGGCSPWGHKELDTTERLHFHFSLSCIGEGNGNPLQCSCLENPRDEGACWAAVYGVAQSRTRLKRLSSSSSSTVEEHFTLLGVPLYILTIVPHPKVAPQLDESGDNTHFTDGRVEPAHFAQVGELFW